MVRDEARVRSSLVARLARLAAIAVCLRRVGRTGGSRPRTADSAASSRICSAAQPPSRRKPRPRIGPRTSVCAISCRRPRRASRERREGRRFSRPSSSTFSATVSASSTADGLTEAFADKPEIAIADKSRDASGLVRDDYYDWPKAAHDLATGKDHIDFVVIMVGINDLQPMRDGADTLDPLSDRWRALYAQRVEAVVAPFQAAHIPVAWVGLPPMRTDRFNADVVKLNEIDREHAEKAGAKYIDIWDAFADQNGQYDAYGPNVDGQNVKLRGRRRHPFHQGRRAQGRAFPRSRDQARLRQEQAAERHRDPAARHRAGRRRHQRADPPRNGRARRTRRVRLARRRSNRPSRWPDRSCR